VPLQSLDHDGVGVFDLEGNLIVNFINGWAWGVSDGMIRFYDYEIGKTGFYNTLGDLTIPFVYDGARDFSEGRAAVRVGDWEVGAWGFIDTEGNEIVTGLDAVFEFHEGLAVYKNGEKWGYIDTEGNEVVPAKYDATYPFFDGMGTVENNFKTGFVDHSGKEVIPIQFNYSYSFSYGIALVFINQEGKFIDKTGKTVFPQIWDRNDNM